MTQPTYTPRQSIITGERIYLSTFQVEDVPTLTRWFSQLDVTAFIGMQGTAYTLEQEQQWYENYVKQSHTERHFAVIDAHTHQLIGNVSLMDIRQVHQRAELGIVIGERAYWSKGYGREAIKLMCQYGVAFLNLQTIYLWHVSYNVRGRISYEAAGFVETGRIPESRLFNGVRYDDVVMTLHARHVAPTALHGQFGQLPI
jgi:RimJ/RimL family protein N-acetyltransferase